MFTPSSIAHWPVGPVCEPPNKVWTPLLPCRSSSSVHPASLWPPPELSGTFVLHPDQKKKKKIFSNLSQNKLGTGGCKKMTNTTLVLL